MRRFDIKWGGASADGHYLGGFVTVRVGKVIIVFLKKWVRWPRWLRCTTSTDTTIVRFGCFVLVYSGTQQ